MGRVWPSRPASAFSFSPLRLDLVLTRGDPPDFHRNVHFFNTRHTPSGQSRVYRVTLLRTDDVHCLESAALAGLGMDPLMCAFHFPHLVLVCNGHVMLWDSKSIGGGTVDNMYICMVMCNNVWVNRVRLPNLLVVSWTGKMRCLQMYTLNMGTSTFVHVYYCPNRHSQISSVCDSYYIIYTPVLFFLYGYII